MCGSIVQLNSWMSRKYPPQSQVRVPVGNSVRCSMVVRVDKVQIQSTRVIVASKVIANFHSIRIKRRANRRIANKLCNKRPWRWVCNSNPPQITIDKKGMKGRRRGETMWSSVWSCSLTRSLHSTGLGAQDFAGIRTVRGTLGVCTGVAARLRIAALIYHG